MNYQTSIDMTNEWLASMPTFRKRTTGVDNSIFVSAKFPGHAPRIKVAIDPPTHIDRFGNSASVAIGDGAVLAGKLPRSVLAQVRAWLDLNRDVLIDYWEQRIDDEELRERLQKLEP